MRKSDGRYKQDNSRRVRQTPLFAPNTYLFLDYPQLRPSLESAAEFLAMKEYNKFQSRASGPFPITSVQSNTFTIHENGIPNTVFSHRVTHASRAAPLSWVSNNNPSTPQRQRKDIQHSTNNKREVERIIKHIGKGRDTNYCLRWYGYRAKVDTVKLADLIPKHLRRCYC